MPNDVGTVVQLEQIRAEKALGGNGSEVAEWPKPFFINEKGVWYQPPASQKDLEPSAVWICAPFEAIAETADEHGDFWGLLLRWTDRNGQLHEWAMPRRLLHAAGNEIAQELDHAGLAVGTGKAPHELLKQLLGRIKTSHRRRCVPRTGWHQTEAGHVYLLPSGETFGPGGADVILQTGHVAPADATHARGTLAEWQEYVARYAICNHRVGLFTSAAFAPPLLDITSDPSGGIHLHGGSQTGKTTALRCGASAWGKADTSGQIRTWRATSNGMEGVAAETCDALLSLDEISMVDPREAGEIVYSLANETGKARATREGAARARRIWRTIFASTGEIPLSVKMGERGATPMAGQEVRLANIPADAGKGLGVYQTLHGFPSGAALSNHLRAASCTYYGTAARAFLDKLVHARATDPEGLTALIAELRRDFMAALKLLPDADGQVISVAGRFSLIAAAGELARVFCVLPWPLGEAMRAARACFLAWLDARGGSGAAEDTQAVLAVRHFLGQFEELRFTPLTAVAEQSGEDDARVGRSTLTRAGFRRQTPDGTLFLIFPGTWKNEVCRGLDPDRAAAAVDAAGHLVKGDGRNWAKKHRIPGIGPTRLYTVRGSILQGDV